LLAFALTACGGSSPQVQPPAHPVRVVSMNPCIDAVLREVADPAQIASISHYSQDARATSVPLDWAMRYPANTGTAEEVIAAAPDLVLTGPHVSLQTADALRRLGIPLVQVGVPDSIEGNLQQVADIASHIGRPREGEALTARITAALDRSAWHGRPISAVIWQGSGLVPGQGTLADALLTHTGFTNAAQSLGLKQWDILPLEELLAHPPVMILAGVANMGTDAGDANRMLGHPALRKARDQIHVADFPSSLLHCGGPVLIPTLERLAAIRQTAERHP